MWLRFGLLVAGVLAVGGTVYGGYRYVTNLQENLIIAEKNISTLRADNASLLNGIVDQKNTIESLRKDINEINRVQDISQENFVVAREQVHRLEKRLRDRDVSVLVVENPALLEEQINQDYNELLRCGEILTGSPPEADENCTNQ